MLGLRYSFVCMLILFASPALAGDAVIFNGNFVKALKDDLLLYDTARIITGTADPTAVATTGEKGSLYLRQTAAGDGEAYIKRDTGLTTNWDLIQTSASTILTPSRAVVTDGSGYLAASATTSTQIGYLSATTGTTGTGNLVLATGPTIGLVNATGLPLTTGVTGTLPVGNGGTGAASLTDHGVMLGSGTGAVSVTAVGTTGQVLTGVTGGDPVWAAPATDGTVTSVDVSGGTTGLTTSGGPVTTSGVITLSGTLVVANGGTGVTSSTGTGSVVLSTSPTLVTPALGTPASGVATNLTGLPLTTGVTGTLPVANGGTGVTASTGSGSVVLNTSPTLVTPALGTPASGVATNLTGLPLTTGVTGTLPVANGGTGVSNATQSYTPAVGANTNVSSITERIAYYYRIGNLVTVFGTVDVTPTAAGPTQTAFQFNLPIASSFAASTDLAGTIVGQSGVTTYQSGTATANAANDTAQFNFLANTNTAQPYTYSYTYIVQ